MNRIVKPMNCKYKLAMKRFFDTSLILGCLLSMMVSCGSSQRVQPQLEPTMRMADNMLGQNMQTVVDLLTNGSFKKVKQQGNQLIYRSKQTGMGCEVNLKNGVADRVKMLLPQEQDLAKVTAAAFAMQYKRSGMQANALAFRKPDRRLSASTVAGGIYRYGFVVERVATAASHATERPAINMVQQVPAATQVTTPVATAAPTPAPTRPTTPVAPHQPVNQSARQTATAASADLNLLGLTGSVRSCVERLDGESTITYTFDRNGRLQSSRTSWNTEVIENPQRDRQGRITRYGGIEEDEMEGVFENYKYITWKRSNPTFVEKLNYDGPCCSITETFVYGNTQKPYLITQKKRVTQFPCSNETETFTFSAFDSHGNWTKQQSVIKIVSNDGAPTTTERHSTTRTISYWE